MEPEIEKLAPVTTKPLKKTRPTISKDASTPYFEQLIDEAEEAAREIQERPVFNVVKPSRPL